MVVPTTGLGIFRLGPARLFQGGPDTLIAALIKPTLQTIPPVKSALQQHGPMISFRTTHPQAETRAGLQFVPK